MMRWLIGITLNAYFRKVVIRGMENIPSNVPIIIVANHPSAFMDPMVIGTITARPLHFIAAAEFMGRGLKSWIYRKQLNMIPVYRPATTKGEANNNAMFSKCFELLASKGAVVVFPEGTSVTEKRLRKLKTGAARMALGTRDHTSGRVEVSIVPVGLNYANPHRFQSDVFVNIGKPVTTNGFTSDPDGVASLTSEIEHRLKETLIHVRYEELDSVVKKAELIMKSSQRKQHATTSDEKFKLQQQLIQSIQSIHEADPEAVHQLEVRLDSYLTKIRKMGIFDSSVAALSPVDSLSERLRLNAGRPLFIAGFAVNAIPYYSTVFAFRRLNLFQREGAEPQKHYINPAFRGSIAISVGMIVFTIWYLGWAAAFINMTGLWWFGIVTLIGFYLAGLFTLRYIGWTMIADQKSKIRKILGKGTDLYSELIVERREIMESINRMTKESQIK